MVQRGRFASSNLNSLRQVTSSSFCLAISESCVERISEASHRIQLCRHGNRRGCDLD